MVIAHCTQRAAFANILTIKSNDMHRPQTTLCVVLGPVSRVMQRAQLSDMDNLNLHSMGTTFSTVILISITIHSMVRIGVAIIG